MLLLAGHRRGFARTFIIGQAAAHSIDGVDSMADLQARATAGNGNSAANATGARRLRITLDKGVATLWLDNPSRRNALDLEAWTALSNLTDWPMDWPSVRALVVRGVSGCFCAGADIGEFDTVRRDALSARAYEDANEAAFAALQTLPVPTIALIEGPCFGGGFGIAAACDVRFATPDARFAIPAARLGLAYPLDAMARIVATLGEQNAKAMLYGAEAFPAERLAQWGFLWRVSPAAIEEGLAFAARVERNAPLTNRATKLAIAAHAGGDRSAAQEAGDATFTSDDYGEGRTAFRQKRAPRFQGR